MASLSSYRTPIKSIQRGSSSITFSATSRTVTITSVDTLKSVLIMTGKSTANSGGSPVQASRLFAGGTLTNSTTLTFKQGAATGMAIVFEWQVIEYY